MGIAIIVVSSLAGAGCQCAGTGRAKPSAPASTAPRVPGAVARTDPAVARVSTAPDDEDDEDDEDEDEVRGPEAVAALGAERASLSPARNREGPFGDRPAEGPESGPVLGGPVAMPGEATAEVGDDGYAPPDLLMKAFGLEDPSTRIYGWLEGGILFNPARPRDHQNLPETSSDLANRWQVQQMYIVVERPLRSDDDWDYGYRVDNLFGTDWSLYGDEGLFPNASLPHGYGYTPTQFYADVHVPYLTSRGLDVRVGRFISLAGYESAFAPGRPLRSTGFLFNYSHPFTHLGVLTTLNLTDRIQIFNAAVNGWDRWFGRRDQWGYMGGINWDSRDERTNLTLAYYGGPNQISQQPPAAPSALAGPTTTQPSVSPPGRTARGGNETGLVSAVVTREWDRRWTTIFEADYGADRSLATSSSNPRRLGNSTWYGAGIWVLYTFTDRWTGVFRTDIFRDVGGVRTGFDDTYSETTLGLVYKPASWLWIRPEIDYYRASGAPPFETHNGRANDEISFGFDVLLLY
ncbi:outer membrane beta-barrel protein [Singulisphaera sp. PoT]|uniref:outer membrane beta-barrel protein n=1 Tax=Singulisphaera sp. PoT TaxID=3411797 RepID=UPI003BF4D4AD